MPNSSQKVFENFLEMTENGPLAEKQQDRKNKRTRQKNEKEIGKGNQIDK